MSEINVISRTQRIIVETVSGSVTIIDVLTYIRIKGG